jgi:Tfp pilus assembly protein PilO
MRKLSRFEKFGLMAAVIIAFTFLYVKKVYEPQEARLKKTIASLNNVVGQINNLKDVPPPATVKRNLKRYREKLEAVSAKLEGSQMHTGADREVTLLLSAINKKITRNGLRVNALTPGGTSTDELLVWNLFQMDLEGSFHGFLQFMRDLKDFQDAVKIENLQMEKSEDRPLHLPLNLMI